MEVIEQLNCWRDQYGTWKSKPLSESTESVGSYPFVENEHAPFTPARRALPMLNLALISSAGSYIDGTERFDTSAPYGDLTLREIPSEIDLSDLRFSARGYDSTFVQQDANVQIPLARLFEFESNRVIGQVNSTFWSFCGFIPDAGRLVNELLPKLVERVKRYEVQAALLIPASRLCHQSIALAARAIESAGIPTMTLTVDREIMESVRPPRAAYYEGQLGSVAGKPNWPEHQRRILDEALRWIEPMDEPEISKLAVELESQVQHSRGER
ncbi:MAG TPA: glycine/sarcosine/betaine reductase selenoprotein B family protein [Pyrinomonadaceae bacterium]|nr:glycine/sarcosine/betaine reductase selenoprotein B family protein [Pyrinomonadaceae bacterium]